MTLDVLIVGAGIAGASLAWRLAGTREVMLLEAEIQPGLHSTGRSAAMYMASYGSPQARALTRASRGFYLQPPAGFADVPLVAPRGVLYVGWQGQQGLLEKLTADFRASGTDIAWLDATECLRRVPVLRAEGLLGALCEQDALDIDVHALHQGFLRGARRGGVELWTEARLQLAMREGDRWRVTLADGREVFARTLVNAAGAWADPVAQACGVPPLGIEPRRRSAFTFDPPENTDHRSWHAVIGADESWYFKPDAGQLLGSPANADPVPPHDVQPEELDIALGIDAIQRHSTLQIRRPRRTWAGLRSFSPDSELVIGDDPAVPGFFWLAGQGGYGIQSAPGASELAASLLRGEPLPAACGTEGVDVAALSPARLRQGSSRP